MDSEVWAVIGAAMIVAGYFINRSKNEKIQKVFAALRSAYEKFKPAPKKDENDS